MATNQSTDRLVTESHKVATGERKSLAVQTLETLQFMAGGRRAMGVLTFAGQPSDGEIITIGDGVNTATVFEADDDSSITAGRVSVTIGATAEATLDNLLTAINAEGEPTLAAAQDTFQVAGTKSGTTIINLKNYKVGTAGNVTVTTDWTNLTVTGMIFGTDVGQIDTEMQMELIGADIEIGSVNLLTSGDVQIDPSAAYAEDTAHTTADWMTPAGVVRTDTRAAFAADGDYVPMQATANGDLRVRDDDLLTEVGAIGDTASPVGSVHAQLRTIAEGVGGVSSLISGCEDKDDWTAISDAANISDATEHITGTQAVNWDKEGAGLLHVNSGIFDSIDSVDMSSYGPSDHIMLSLNVSSTTLIATAVLRLGTDVSNYTEWQWDDDQLITGWQILTKKLSDYTSITGTGMQQAAITYVSFHLVFDTNTDTLNDITLDHIGFISAESIMSEDDDIHEEDVLHISGDKGSMPLAVRTDTRAVLSNADGDYTPLQATPNGDLRTRDDDLLTEVGAIADAAVEGDTQGSVHAQLRGANTNAGAVADAIVDAGATGSLSAKLRRTTSTLGQTDDAIVDAGAVGTLSAKLRRTTSTLGQSDDAAVEGDSAGTVDAQLRGINKNAGAVADAAVTEDAAGSQAAKLRGINKVLGASDNAAVEGDTAGTIDAQTRGINKNAGAVADAKVSADAAGSISAKLRGINTRLGTIGDAAAPDGSQAAQLEAIHDDVTRIHIPIDNIIATADWANSTDASGINLETDHIPAHDVANSLSFDKDGVTVVDAFYGKLISAVDGSELSEDSVVNFAVRHGNYTNVAYVWVRLGTDAGNYHQFQFDPAAFSTTLWSHVLVPLHDGIQTGTGLDLSDITYVAFGVTMDAAANTISDVFFNHIHVHSVSVAELSVSSESTANTVRVSKMGAPSNAVVQTDAGAMGTGVQRITLATDDSQFGSVGEAASTTGAVHAQLRYIGENIASAETILQECDDNTEFTAINDAQNLADQANHITGSAAVEWDKTAGDNVNSGIQDTITAIDLSQYGAGDSVMVNIYIPDLTNVASVRLRLGADTSNLTYWTWADTEIIAGEWNTLVRKIGNISGVVGDGWTQSAITYVSIIVIFDAAANTLNNMIADRISVLTSEAAACHIHHEEDTAHTNRDEGIMALAVRTDARGSICGTDGDYAPLQLTSVGEARVRDDDANTDLDTMVTLVHIEDTAHTTADPGLEVLAVRNDTLASLVDTDGDYSPLQVDVDGALYVKDEDVLAAVGNTTYAEDTAHQTADEGVQVLVVRNDTLASLVDTDGDYAPLQVDVDGALYTKDEDVLTELQSITYVEDTAHTTADPGIEILVVRNDTLASLCDTDGDYAPLQVSAIGALFVEDIGVNADMDTLVTLVHEEDTAHTTADFGVQTLAVRNDTLASLVDTDGDYAPLQVDADGALYVKDEDVLTELASTSYAEDVAHQTADPGTQILAVRNDTLASLCDTDGDYTPLQVDVDGAVYTKDEDVLAAIGDITYVEDTAHQTADEGVQILAVRNDTLATLGDTDGDYVPLQVDADGAVYTIDEGVNTDMDTLITLVHIEDTAHTTADPGIQTLAVRTDVRTTLADTTGDYAPLQLTDTGDLRTRDDDLLTEIGAIGAASDVDGNVHGQLRYIGENIGSTEVTIQECDDNTDFAAVNDAANLADQTNHVTGDSAVEWDKTVGDNVESGIDDTITAINLGRYGVSDYVMVNSYIPDLTNVASVKLRLGTSNAHYTEWIWDDSELIAASWQRLYKKINDFNAIVGNGWDQDAVTWVSWVVIFDGAANLLDNMIVDRISVVTAETISLIDDVVKRDDDLYQALDKGVFVLSVRNDNLGTTFATVDQSYAPMATTEKGALHVAVGDGVATAEVVSDAALTTDVDGGNALHTIASMYARQDADTVEPVVANASGQLVVEVATQAVTTRTESNPIILTQAVAVPGTREAFAATQQVVYFMVEARKVGGINTGNVYIGTTTVDKDADQSIVLQPGEKYEFVAPAGISTDLDAWFVDADNAADGITGFYLA